MRKTWIIFMLNLIVLGIGTGIFLYKGQDTAIREIVQKAGTIKGQADFEKSGGYWI